MAKYLDAAGVAELWRLFKDRNSIRNNDYNYKADFIPYSGQICFVDTSRNGLQVKVGDGVTPWSNLKYFTADDTNAGIMKLYSQTGENTDGTMTQKSITDELHTKFSVEMSGDETVRFYIK